MPLLRRSFFAPVLMALVGATLYANSLQNPFVFDDLAAIAENDDLRQILPLWLDPDASARPSLNARPLVRLSLALNYAVHGLEVPGYHLINTTLHILCAITLGGLVRRTLQTPALNPRFGAHAYELALGCSLLWLAHPLNNQVSNYLVQRSEPLMALGYLSMLYSLALSNGGDKRWWIAAALACTLGMASKENMVSAPLIALLYDRTFLAGSFRQALALRARLYMGLAATWLLLSFLLIARPHGESIGFATELGSWVYLLNQCTVIADYLYKSIWPHPLILDYGFPLPLTLGDIWPQGLMLIGLLVITGWTLYRHPPIGFCLALFFAVLAPTSSFVPIVNEVGAERRIYLPLAALIAVVITAAYGALGHTTTRRRTFVAILGLVLAAFSWQTLDRNRDFHTPMALARTVVAAVPHNPRGQTYLGLALVEAGHVQQGIQHYQRAIALRPTFGEAHNNLGIALGKLGRHTEAIPCYQTAIAHHPRLTQAYNNLGNALLSIDRTQEAIAYYREAIDRRPAYADAHNNLGIALATTGQINEAQNHFRRALEIRPDFPAARKNLEISKRSNRP